MECEYQLCFQICSSFPVNNPIILIQIRFLLVVLSLNSLRIKWTARAIKRELNEPARGS
jgi:hypothetical protein